ncbi:MAG: IMP dehydrogenase [Bacteroidetes bacterium]|nr:IMP dehydrogenase [Bacteroidota bacterium]MBT5530625.1 IMP dehydrogenase [Cytophagia bacterium]MBT3421839.1 IMP dehydrogenase [Bacteroidota bacterium]MBT3933293.1 IMP dehydrogenase [Bacteroidota bacterium]MBT4337854.1 IMP dehydrogenase [Bacteroidota bacterium]
MIEESKKFIGRGLTYDDVLVVPAYSEVLPREVNTKTKLTKNIDINIPFVSAAMDTVTETAMAIAIAREGGIGIIHKNMSVEEQALMVKRVKRSESGVIQDPIVLNEEATIGEAIQLMTENSISGIPIVDDNRVVVGILTNRDIFFEKDFSRNVREVMTGQAGLITAPAGTDIKEAEEILKNHKVEKLPVIDSEGKIHGLFTLRDIKKTKDHPLACKDEYGRLRVGAAIGVTENALEHAEALVNAGVDVLSVDSAHGNSKKVLDLIASVKKKFPNIQLIGGNVAVPEGALALVKAGVDAVKIGIGPGSICTTRVIAGIGVPQLTAVYECAEALKDTGIPIIADGGIRYSGDIVKAIAAGASSVMAGSLFAGVEEAPGETIIYEGRKFKHYRGMGSLEAMKKGSGDRYFQDPEEEISKLVPEGIVGRVPYKGTLNEVLYQFIGGLKAGMGYTGSATIENLQQASFIHITPAGVRESHPHDIMITKEAPNYSPR